MLPLLTPPTTETLGNSKVFVIPLPNDRPFMLSERQKHGIFSCG
jgi:hypothetical protein